MRQPGLFTQLKHPVTHRLYIAKLTARNFIQAARQTNTRHTVFQAVESFAEFGKWFNCEYAHSVIGRLHKVKHKTQTAFAY